MNAGVVKCICSLKVRIIISGFLLNAGQYALRRSYKGERKFAESGTVWRWADQYRW
jgi:hypothetical protein